MGFEQLAELKKQLAKEAKAAKRQAQPSEAEKPARQARPGQRDAKGERGAKGEREAKGQRDVKGPRPAKNEPVDPVVRVIGKLQKRFPAAFPKNPTPKVPLKIGILADLLSHAEALALNEAQIRDAVSTWCRGSRYWACLVDGAVRVDLEGAPAGSVTARDAAFARRQAKGGAAARRKGEGVPAAAKAAAEEAAQQAVPDTLHSPDIAQPPDTAQAQDVAHSADTAQSPD